MASMHKLIEGTWYKWEMAKPCESPYLYAYLLAVGRDNLPKQLKNRLWDEEDWQIDNG